VASREPRTKSLKYEYKEDQWSPLNPLGKKQYDREFLMSLQSNPLSLQKPSNLPPMWEIVKVCSVVKNISITKIVNSFHVQHYSSSRKFPLSSVSTSIRRTSGRHSIPLARSSTTGSSSCASRTIHSPYRNRPICNFCNLCYLLSDKKLVSISQSYAAI
jgi:hypothetical protein